MKLTFPSSTLQCALATVALVHLGRRVHADDLADFDARWTARVGVRECGAERVSTFADPHAIAVESALLALAPGLRPRERAAIVAAPALVALAGKLLKHLVPRERPSKHRFDPQGAQSFPSTHTAHATALALTGASIARRRGVRAWPALAAAALGSWVGAERVRAAAHWPSDVLAGALLGAAAAAVVRGAVLR